MDLYPAKAQFLTGEEVILKVETAEQGRWTAQIKVFHLNDEVLRKTVCGQACSPAISLGPFGASFAGYGVSASFESGGEWLTLETAFDVVDDPGRSLRYGFLSDFAQEDNNGDAIDWLCKCHINLTQYYDWSYRHHQLVSAEETYQDMMGKTICKSTVKSLIRRGSERGIRAIAYGAVYAAGREFFEAHRDWAFYNSSGQPFVFINVFYIMNLRRGSPWCGHLLGQYRSAIEGMGFHGIHMDTYGFPKTAYSHLTPAPELVRLDEELPALIEEARKRLGDDACLIFNNVGNWPACATASAPQDAVYIEVWPPYERYFHIAQLIAGARASAGGAKPVILAAYLAPFREGDRGRAMASAQLLTAAIVSHGGHHLLTGECKAVLTQGYYSDYTRLDDSQAAVLRRYYDFMIRYLELFYDPRLKNVSMTHTGWDNFEYQCLSHPVSSYGEAGKLWMILREQERRKCLYLVNLCGCMDDYWNKGKEPPAQQRDLRFRVQVDSPVKGIYAASPDWPALEARELPFECTEDKRGRFVEFALPEAPLWTVIWLDF